MSCMTTKTNQSFTIEAKIIRANGKVEDLGVICRSRKPLWKRIKEAIKWQI